MPLLALLGYDLKTSTALIGAVGLLVALHGLGLFLIVYGGYSLWRSHSGRVGKPHLVAKGYDYLAGMVSGALGSAYNSHGVPVAVYGMLKQWPATHLRAILQAHFLCVGVLVVFSHVAAGFWSLEAVKVLLMVIPGLVLTVPLGNWIVDRMAPARAIKFVYGALIIFGLLLMLK